MIFAPPRITSAAALLLAAASGVQAAAQPTNLGNFNGDNVVYSNVLEDSNGLFGTPGISGDTLDFTSGLATDFEAQSNFGGTDSIQAALWGTVLANPGLGLDRLTVEASGSFNLALAFGLATADTAVQAQVSLGASIVAIDGVDLVGGPQPLSTLTATFADFDLVQFPGANPLWSGELTLDLAARAQDELGLTGHITAVAWTIDTALTATSVNGTASDIALRGFDALTLTVPEPATAALLAAPLVLAVRRRRA